MHSYQRHWLRLAEPYLLHCAQNDSCRSTAVDPSLPASEIFSENQPQPLHPPPARLHAIQIACYLHATAKQCGDCGGYMIAGAGPAALPSGIVVAVFAHDLNGRPASKTAVRQTNLLRYSMESRHRAKHGGSSYQIKHGPRPSPLCDIANMSGSTASFCRQTNDKFWA